MNCPVCGRAVQPGDAFCGTCGTALAATAQPPAHQVPAEQQPFTQQIEPVDPPPQHAAASPPAAQAPDPYQPPAQFQPTPWAQPPPYQEAPDQQAPYPPAGYPAPYDDQPSVAEDLLSDEPGYAEPAYDQPAASDPNYPGSYYSENEPKDRTTKWIVGGIVAVLAFAAIVLSGLALIKRSRHDTNGQRSSSSNSAGKSSSGASTSSGKSSSSASTKTPPKPVRSVTISGAPSGTNYTVAIWSEDTQRDCAAHAYGKQVVGYLKKYPCSAMTRRVGTTTVNGKPVGFALTVITIPGTSAQPDKYSGDFLKLVSKDGTGNISDLLREGKRLPSGPAAVPSPDAFSVYNKSADVIIVEAWYLSGKTPSNDPPLTKLATDFFQQKGVG